MAISSLPVLVPGKFINGVFVRSDLVGVECNPVMAFIFDVPISWEVADAFSTTDNCVSLMLVLDEDC